MELGALQQPIKPKGMGVRERMRFLFPVPIYVATRDLVEEEEKEKKEINDIIESGMRENAQNLQSVNTHVLDQLHNLKEFIEEHINLYVKEIINLKHDYEFYITQSWINVNEPGQGLFKHFHSNSIISGVYYIATVEDDGIVFYDPNMRVKKSLNCEGHLHDRFPVDSFEEVNTRDLIMFPSWLDHGLEPNPKATTTRVSLAFNTFAKGTFGNAQDLNELILS